MTMVLQDSLAVCRAQTQETRRARRALKLAKPLIYIYKNNPDGSSGLIHCGRVNYRDCPKYDFPKKKNVSSQGYFSVRASHYLAKFIAHIPNNPEECKNYVVRVDMYGGSWRWTGLGHHWAAETKDGVDVITFHFNDDMQTVSFLLAPPNPVLPIDIFQFPRVWPEFGPSIWCISTLLLLNIVRKEVLDPYNLLFPDDPFSLASWTTDLLPQNWQMHVKCNPFSYFLDSSLWTVLGSRMQPIDAVIADALDDGQLCLDYRRIFTDEGEQVPEGVLTGALGMANGALVLEVNDRSGFTLPGGTFFNGTAAAGLARSVLTYGAGFIEDSTNEVLDDEGLYPDEYYQHGFLGTFAATPGITVRDSHYNDLQSIVTHSTATAGTVVIGGANPTVDAIVRLMIEATGNLLGYFLLGGFDSLGTMAADAIMPFLNGTILAWIQWKNFGRTTNLGWVHLLEVFQQGADTNAWSLSGIAALRAGFKSTEAQTSHTMVIGGDTWLIPGLHCQIGDRIASTAGCLQRIGIDLLFVNQIEEQTLTGSADGKFDFIQKVGQNKAAMSQGERASRLMKRTLTILHDIGVHLIS